MNRTTGPLQQHLAQIEALNGLAASYRQLILTRSFSVRIAIHNLNGEGPASSFGLDTLFRQFPHKEEKRLGAPRNLISGFGPDTGGTLFPVRLDIQLASFEDADASLALWEIPRDKAPSRLDVEFALSSVSPMLGDTPFAVFLASPMQHGAVKPAAFRGYIESIFGQLQTTTAMEESIQPLDWISTRVVGARVSRVMREASARP